MSENLEIFNRRLCLQLIIRFLLKVRFENITSMFPLHFYTAFSKIEGKKITFKTNLEENKCEL